MCRWTKDGKKSIQYHFLFIYCQFSTLSAIITYANLDGNIAPTVLWRKFVTVGPHVLPLYQHFMCHGSIASYYKCNEAEVIEAFIDYSNLKFTAMLNCSCRAWSKLLTPFLKWQLHLFMTRNLFSSLSRQECNFHFI